MILARPSFKSSELEWDVDTLRLTLFSGEEVESRDRFAIELLLYANESFGILGLRALFSVRFQAWAAMLVGVFGVVGSVLTDVAEYGSDARNECVGVADAEKDVCRVFLVLVTRDVRLASRLDFRGGWLELGLDVFEDVLVEDALVWEGVKLEIDSRRIEDG